jgi:mannose-6-phosphate isomerase
MSLHLLPANQPANRFYRGGPGIARFRGVLAHDGHVPEDWVGSTTTVFGHDALGLTVLADGTRLIDTVQHEPERWLGSAHVARWGADTKLLVKLLDAGQRLPVHAHPDTAFAGRHLHRPHGKAEAWHILSSGEVHLGLREDIALADLADLVEHQRSEELLALLHTVAVQPGTTVFVPPGVLHAIGRDVFLAEVQEPEDLSILLEWRDFAIDGASDGHLGLGFPTALQAVERARMPAETLTSLIAEDATLPASASPYFRLERRDLRAGDTIAPGFAIAVVVAGAGALHRGGAALPVAGGDTVLIEHAGGPIEVEGHIEVVELRPPHPAALPLGG